MLLNTDPLDDLPNYGEIYLRTMQVSSYVCRDYRNVLERDEVANESMLVLYTKRYDPELARGRPFSKCLMLMVPEIVKKTAWGLLRRKQRGPRTATFAEMDMDLIDGIDTSSVLDIMEDLDSPIEDAIEDRRPLWNETLCQNRLDGRVAWSLGRSDAVRRHANQAGLFSTLTLQSTPRLVIPVLGYVRQLSSAEIASERGVSVAMVDQTKSRFMSAVRRRSIIEMSSFCENN